MKPNDGQPRVARGGAATALRGPRTAAWITGLAAAVLIATSVLGSAGAAEVNVYSHRKEELIKPQLDAFTAATGIKVNLVTGNADALIERMRSEGRNSPVDVVLTSDAGRLYKAKQLDLLQEVRSAVLEDRVPPRLRDPEGFWYGLSIRARPIFYARDRVDPAELSTYEALTDEKWRGRILVRSSSNIYNQSLLAAMIAERGPAAAEKWARGIVTNLARKPQGGDTDQLRALAAGEGDVAIANTYYFGRILDSERKSDRDIAAKIAIFWPNQTGRGVHVNISGGAVARFAPHRAEAIRFLEYLVSDEAQEIYAEVDHEFPIRDDVSRSKIVAGMGTFRADEIPLEQLGAHSATAVRIFDRAGWR